MCHSIEMLIVKILENRVCLNIYICPVLRSLSWGMMERRKGWMHIINIMNYVYNMHSYSIEHLLYVWAEYYNKKEVENNVVSIISKSDDGIYHITSSKNI